MAPGLQPDAFSWLLHLWLLAAGSEPDAAEPGRQVLAVTTRPAAILMVRSAWRDNTNYHVALCVEFHRWHTTPECST